ncbi:SpoIIE family protein phosphatase [Motiliproteus sp. MSK22-1]|uniref:ATP-binding SpoIIE family protein phosphatase n=1 Tax=Motiliproteus sp. MSK22-1 TaxID=1897630 RepID=UPI0009755819|nr:SpoIIE family protein phosphatase [Motiliproteus sp. MSK22-1]OMH32135.1 hypothetical protein BGP75_15670 [Motiliproteus sp. MSK22-1]
MSLDDLLGGTNGVGKTALVADDDQLFREVVSKVLALHDYQVIEGANGQEAVDLYQRHHPKLILIDYAMPVLNGIDAVRRIREAADNEYVSIIFITASQDEEVLSACIVAGGDDFLTKPFSPMVLRSKLFAIERNRDLYHQVESLHSRMQRDQEIAEQVFSKAVLSGNIDYPGLQSLLQPASTFSGDVLLTAYRPNGDLNLLLGDFTGHGLAASIGALPLSETFRAMTSKGYSGPEIIQQIGRKLCNLLPTGMFLSASFVTLSHEMGTASIWNGGLPDIWLLDRQAKKVKQHFTSIHPPLGIYPPLAQDIVFKVIDLVVSDSLLLSSDGALEARNYLGDYFGEKRYAAAVIEGLQQEDAFGVLTRKLHNYCNEVPLDDDISLVEIPFNLQDPSRHNESESPSDHKSLENQNWQWSICLENQSLATVDPVPMAMSQLQELVSPQSDSQRVFTVLTELYLNALDHGVLELPSAIKESTAGFAEFFAKKESRLATLNTGKVRLAMNFKTDNKIALLTIRIQDSGKGFCYSQWKQSQSQQEHSPLSGRGICLVESLCKDLQYLPPGNQVKATIEWNL